MADRVEIVLATSTGGVGRHVRDLAAALASAGTEVTVNGPAETERLFGFTAAGAGFAPVEISTAPHPVRDARAWRRLAGRTRTADLVHAHGVRAGALAALAPRPADAPLVVTWHNAVLATGPARVLGTGLERLVARRADMSLAVSADLVARIRRLGGTDARLAPVGSRHLGAPARSREDVRAELGAGPGGLVLAVGRLHPQKGYPTLLAAAALLARRDPAPVVAIAGDGPSRGELEAAISATGVPVRLLGRRDDVADLLAAADVVAMPSVWEGSPLAAHEALLAGRPLVATAVGGVPDLLAHGAGVLVPAGDAEALAGEIGRLLDDPAAAAALAERGLRRAADWPDADETVRRVRAVYAELLGRPV